MIASVKNKIKSYNRSIRRFVMPPFLFMSNLWNFRKELWNFRRYDYQYNIDILTRSLELSAEFYESDKTVSAQRGTSNEIRQTIQLFRYSEDPYTAAEEFAAISVDDACAWDKIEKSDIDICGQKSYSEFVREIENTCWEKGMDNLKEKMRSWWD